MEITTAEYQELSNQYYSLASNLILNEHKSAYEVRNTLIEQGLDKEIAYTIVEKLETQKFQAQQKAEQKIIDARAKKDILYGALWCIGGTILTLLDIGFIFYGAILFGGIQFFRGLMNYCS